MDTDKEIFERKTNFTSDIGLLRYLVSTKSDYTKMSISCLVHTRNMGVFSPKIFAPIPENDGFLEMQKYFAMSVPT
jgi:hypothetical protein